MSLCRLYPRVPHSPHREFSPILFTCPDQHPSAAASNLVSFGGSDDARWTTACHWRLQMRRSCRARTTTPPSCILRSPVHPAQAWMPIFSASCLTLWRSWVWNGRSKHDVFTPMLHSRYGVLWMQLSILSLPNTTS